MEREGWIASRWVQAENGRKRKYYSIKKDGKKALKGQREQWGAISEVFKRYGRNNMFNLEQAILEWRRRMLAADIKSPSPMDELEIPLREEIERQMKSGLSAQEALEAA